jgi:hypothetical protein
MHERAIERTRRTSAALILLAAAWIAGCEEQGAAPSGGATAAKSGDAKSGDTQKANAKPAVTLKAADVDAAYESEINAFAKMKDPMDKKIEAFVAKIGKPAKEEGGSKIWYAVDGAGCKKFLLESSGALTTTSTDKADCGL